MGLRLQHFIFVALVVSLVSLAYGLNYMWFSDTERTVFGELIRFWNSDTLAGPVRSNDDIAVMGTPLFYDWVIAHEWIAYGNPGHPAVIPEPDPIHPRYTPPLELPQTAALIRTEAIAQGHYFNQGDTMQARVHIEGDSLRIWWAPIGSNFDTSSFTFHALPESAVVFFDCPIVQLWGTVSTTLIFGCAGRAGLEDNILYASSSEPQHGQIIPNHVEKFALVAEDEIKILNTWSNGREDSHGLGLNQTNPDSTDVFLNGLFFALGSSFTFEQQNDLDSGYVYQNPPGTPHTDDRGTVWLWGGLTQRQRGYVHRSNNASTGYLKNYRYDPQLKFWNLGIFDVMENVVVPTSLDFGEVRVGNIVQDTAHIVNEFVPLTIDSVRAASPFSVAQPDSYSWWQNVAIAYAPTEVGTFSDTVRIYNAYYDQWFTVPVSGVGVSSSSAHSSAILPPSSFSLSAFPNPFNPTTEVTFSVPTAGRMAVRVFDILGQQVSTLQDGFQTAGEHRVSFDGGQLPAGIYFLRLEAASHQRTLKLVLLK